MVLRLFVLLVLLASPLLAQDIALRDGEALSYRVSWGIFGRAGEIEINAQRLAPDAPHKKPPLQIVTTTSTRGLIRAFYPFDGQAELNFSPETDRLVRAEAKTQTKKRDTHATMVFDYEAEKARYVDHLRDERSVTLDLPPGRPLDLITSLIQARTWDLQVGASHPALVLFDDDFYPLIITAESIDTIDTRWGPRRAYRLVPRMEGEPRGLFKRGGSVQVWISADEDRLPLRFEVAVKVGTATAILVDYRPPATERPRTSEATPVASIENATVSPPTPRPRNQSRLADLPR